MQKRLLRLLAFRPTKIFVIDTSNTLRAIAEKVWIYPTMMQPSFRFLIQRIHFQDFFKENSVFKQ